MGNFERKKKQFTLSVLMFLVFQRDKKVVGIKKKKRNNFLRAT